MSPHLGDQVILPPSKVWSFISAVSTMQKMTILKCYMREMKRLFTAKSCSLPFTLTSNMWAQASALIWTRWFISELSPNFHFPFDHRPTAGGGRKWNQGRGDVSYCISLWKIHLSLSLCQSPCWQTRPYLIPMVWLTQGYLIYLRFIIVGNKMKSQRGCVNAKASMLTRSQETQELPDLTDVLPFGELQKSGLVHIHVGLVLDK